MSPAGAPRALVYGLAVSGEAVAIALQRHGYELVIADDSVTPAKQQIADGLGVELIATPSASEIGRVVERCEMLCPAPGVPETHAAVVAALAAGVPVVSEIDLAYEWEQQRPGGARPILAVTGTDGKTTTTLLAAAMVTTAGRRAAAVGNTELPFVAALDSDAEVFVVECSSFRLNWLRSFRAEASVWLNLAEDHQNWHTSMASYEAAKSQIWAHLRATDVAVGFARDAVVMRNLTAVESRAMTRTFGSPDADYRLDGDSLTGPGGSFGSTREMNRTLPHDITNALAAAALTLETGLADAAAIRTTLANFRHPPHRIEPLGEHRGAQWFNDSKATTPHAALTAIRGFRHIVLLAGGRNKGLDLASLASEHDRIDAVVALGESAPIVAAAFDGLCPVTTATTMTEAVEQAAAAVRPGGVVLLSPACASYDWYPDGGYPARGEDFRRLVSRHFASASGRAAHEGDAR